MSTHEEKRRLCEKNLYDYLRIHARENPDKVYLITENAEISYKEALGTVQGVASEFLSRGMRKGDTVAFRTTRCADIAILSIALCAVGAVAVTTDAHFPVREYIKNSGVDIAPDWYLTNEGASEGLSASGNWALERADGKAAPLALARRETASSEPERAAAEVMPDDPFMIIFTSGSTGKSKAVTLSHKNCIANPVDAMPLFEENADDVAIALLPLNHVFGYAVISCATFCGHGVVFPSEPSVASALACIEKYGVSCIYAVPTFFLELLADGKHKEYDISSLRLGLMAGGPFTANQMRFIEGELGLRLMPGYGMSECVGISTMAYDDPVELRAAGVGRPYPMTEVYILGENGAPLGVNETGEICVCGMTLMLGYYNNEADTRAAIDELGRLHTGDLGYFDEDGILHINGRKKELIIRGGENISGAKIEQALLSVKGVYQAAVVGVRDEKYGEVPCAAVIPEKGKALSETHIRGALKALLSSHETPVQIRVVQAFPLTSSGKVDKLKIKAMFEND